MKQKVLLALLVAAALALVFVRLLRPTAKTTAQNPPPDTVAETSTLATNTQAEIRTTTSPQQPQRENVLSGSTNWALEPLPPGSNLQERLEELARRRGVPLNVLTQEALIQLSNVWQEIRQTANRPIEFYGKAMDGNGMPLGGAHAGFSCQGYPEDYWTTNLLTASDGTFALTGRTGAVLYVHVAMDGYEEAGGTNQNKFMYYSPLPNGGFRADPNNPVVFHLRKKASE
jgi:hypothetical protein